MSDDLKEVGEPLPKELRMILESIYTAAGVGSDLQNRADYLTEILGGMMTSCQTIEARLKALEYSFGIKMKFLCVAEE